MIYRLIIAPVCAFLFLFLVSCEQVNSGDSSGDHGLLAGMDKTPKVVPPDSLTQDMINRVSTSESKVDPNKVDIYLTDKRIDLLEQKVASETGLRQLDAKIKLAREYLYGGYTENSLQLLEEIFPSLSSYQLKNEIQVRYALLKVLGIAHLRKGEQDNCLMNHTPSSCIVPIEKEGQHSVRTGSENAIKVFNELLKMNPNDYNSKYLLNIAHMTLGSWPNAVPKPYLLDEAFFQNKVNFPRFRDIAMNLDINVKGLAGGICLDDFNNDGYIDLFVSSWGFDNQLRYFINDQKGGFEEQTKFAGILGVGGGLNLQHADYNNDGYLDVLVLRGAWFKEEGKIPNSLLRNNGDGTFTDVTVLAGIYHEAPTQTASWADFNLDGYLDLFVGNESGETRFPCEIYYNNGDGTFTNVINKTVGEITGYIKGVTVGDYNNDLLPDVYLSILGVENILLKNVSQANQIRFENVSESTGIGEPDVSFPTWFFDYNNDGYEDILVSGYISSVETAASIYASALGQEPHPWRPRVYLNNKNGTFTDQSIKMGLTEPIFTMGCNYGDLDNDGFLDFYLATGEPNYNSIIPNKMYRNNGGKAFEDVTYAGGFGNIQKGHGVGFADVDNDGDQDIYTVMGGSYEGDIYHNIFYENPLRGENNWITIRLEGTKANRSAIGARIKLDYLEDGEIKSIHRTISIGSSFGGNSLQEEIGINKGSSISKISIKWPDNEGSTEVFLNPPLNKIIYIKQGTQIFEAIDVKMLKFNKISNSEGHAH